MRRIGSAVSDPLQHGSIFNKDIYSPDGVNTASFSPDEKWIVTASNDKTARIWDAGIVTRETPDWLIALAEAVGGKRLNPSGVVESFDPDLPILRKALRNLTGGDDLSRFGQWLAADPYTRTISPVSSITVPEFVAQRLAENTSESVDEAYRLDPGNPLIVASLAKFEADKDRALFLFRHALKRARIESPTAKVEEVRSIARSLFPDLREFSDAAAVPSPNSH